MYSRMLDPELYVHEVKLINWALQVLYILDAFSFLDHSKTKKGVLKYSSMVVNLLFLCEDLSFLLLCVF